MEQIGRLVLRGTTGVSISNSTAALEALKQSQGFRDPLKLNLRKEVQNKSETIVGSTKSSSISKSETQLDLR